MKKACNKALAWALTVCMVFSLLPMSALAVGGDGELSIPEGVLDTDYSVAGSTVSILSDKPMTVSGTTETEHIVVGDGVTANLTFTGVSIHVTNASPVSVESGGTLNLTLVGANTLQGYWDWPDTWDDYFPAIFVPSGATLNIDGDGSLSAAAQTNYNGEAAPAYCYAIGAAGTASNDTHLTGGTITISQATVTADSYSGIGGIGAGVSISDGANVTLENTNTIGIGGNATDGDPGTLDTPAPASVEISGTGTVVRAVMAANSGDATQSTGIGIGGEGCGVTISGGTVTAVGFDAGIGGDGSDVSVSGGTVTATGTGTAGIGGDGCTVGISGASTEVNAYGRYIGIGSDYYNHGMATVGAFDITISGGDVKAWSAVTFGTAAENWAASYSDAYGSSYWGIGGNLGCDAVGKIAISGGTVDARGYYGGIGGDCGDEDNNSTAAGSLTIDISGGVVNAVALSNNSDFGIGGELYSGDSRSITISGDAVVGAWGGLNGDEFSGSSIIGGGDCTSSVITIEDDAKVMRASVIGGSGATPSSGDNRVAHTGGEINILGSACVGENSNGYLVYNTGADHIGGSVDNYVIQGGDGGTITIDTTGVVGASTIGGGDASYSGADCTGGAGGSITIKNGTLLVTHIGGGNGISQSADYKGYGGAGGTIDISGGTFYGLSATVQSYSSRYYAYAGIGGGGGTYLGGSGGTITISGGTVAVQADAKVYNPQTGTEVSEGGSGTGIGAAGIGGGNGADGGSITISGGTVDVTAGVSPSASAAASALPALIGGGSAGGAGNITISGGDVDVSVDSHGLPVYGDDSTSIGQGKGAGTADGWIKITGGALDIPLSTYQTTVARPVPWPTAEDSSPLYPVLIPSFIDEVSYTQNCQIVSMSITKTSGGDVYAYGADSMKPGAYIWLPIAQDTAGWGDEAHTLYNITLSIKKDNTTYGFTGTIKYFKNENFIRGITGDCSLTCTGEVIETLQITSDWGNQTRIYDGADHMPAFTVKNTAGDTLTKDADYTLKVEYVPNDGYGVRVETGIIKNAGGYYVTATGKTGTAYAGMTATLDALWINPKEITGVYGGSAFTKQYDGKTDVFDGDGNKVDSVSLTVDGNDLCAGDALSNIVAQNPRYASAGVGSGIEIDCNSLSYTYTQGGTPSNILNYSIALPSTLTGNITVKVIGGTNLDTSHVTVTKVYDGNTNCALANVSGYVTLVDLVGSEVATVNITGVSAFDNKDAGPRTVTLTIGGLAGANAANYTLAGGADTVEVGASIVKADYTYSLTQAQQTQDFTQGGGILAIDLPQTASGVNGETVSGVATLWHDSACTANQATNASVNALTVGSHNLYVKFVPSPSESNYDTTKITTGNVVLLTVMEGAPQEVSFATAGPIAKTYGDDAFINAATNATTGGALVYSSQNQAVATVDSASGEVTIVGAGTATITATAAAVEGQYRQTTASYTLNVAKKAITVTADNKTKTYGTANPVLTFTHTPSDLVGSDTVAQLGVELSCAAATSSPAGTPVAITGTSGSTKYAVTVTPGTLTINKAEQSKPALSVSSASAITGLSAPTLTASGGNGTGAYSYASTNTGAATVDASTGAITIIGAGTTTFTVTRASDTNYNVSAASDAVTLTVLNRTGITARDTAATDEALITHLQNQGDITVGAVTRVGLTNDFTVAVTGKSALTAYASSNEAQGTAKWIGLLIGNLQVNGSEACDVTDLYYKTAQADAYTQLTSADSDDAGAVGGTAKELILWIKTDATPTKTIWLATTQSGANQTKLTVSFTAYSAPSSGGGAGASAGDPTDTTPTNSGSTTTVSMTTKAAVDASGKASAEIEKAALSDLIGSAKTAESGNKNALIEIRLETPASAKSAEVVLPKSSFDSIANETAADLKINAGVGSVTFDAKAVETISNASSSGDVKIEILSVDKDTLPESVRQLVGNHPVYDFSVTSGATRVSDFAGGTASLSIPYTLKSGEDANAVVVYYIDDSGNVQTVQGAYNAATGTVDFSVAHFSTYAVGYNKVSFADVRAGAWYADAVTFIAARGITSGTTATTFNPDDSISRAQFIVMLMRAYGIEPDKAADSNFSDAGNTYYTSYLAAAKRLGITNGVGGNLFKPDAKITRQDMFTMLYRALKVIGKLPEGTKGASLSSFSDAAAISDYAKTAMEAFVSSGIVSGSSGKLAPTSSSTRAQMAQILFNLLSK